MRQIQRRYLYSAILASVSFIIFYLIFNIHLILSLVLTILIGLGGILLFKEKDIRQFNENDVNNYYFMASKIQNLSTAINNEEIDKHIKNITEKTDAILVALRQRPKKVEQAFDFFDYYFDATYKILYKYKMVQDKKEQNANDNKYIKEAPKFIEAISSGFDKQLKNMQEAKMIDIDNEIKIFEKNLGFEKDNIEVGDEDGQ